MAYSSLNFKSLFKISTFSKKGDIKLNFSLQTAQIFKEQKAYITFKLTVSFKLPSETLSS